MNISDTRLEGKYYDGEFPVARPALLVFNGSEVALTSGDITRMYAPNELRVSPRTGHADRFIILSDGGQYQCEDHPILGELPQEVKSEGPVAWLEDRVSVAIIGIIVVACVLLYGYFYGLPAAAESMVKRIPVETEKSLGKHVLTWFDDNKLFNATIISKVQQDSISGKFDNLHKGLSISPYIKLEFRNSERIGPNAFALPGGTIVITDQMIEKAESEEEILAILAHELGHAEGRHSMLQILQSSLVALTVATITADAASLSVAVAGLPVILVQTKYSRDFETEADDFAFELLARHDISTEAFASFMERLNNDSEPMEDLSFLSTHPMTSKRIKRAREAGSQADGTGREH